MIKDSQRHVLMFMRKISLSSDIYDNFTYCCVSRLVPSPVVFHRLNCLNINKLTARISTAAATVHFHFFILSSPFINKKCFFYCNLWFFKVHFVIFFNKKNDNVKWKFFVVRANCEDDDEKYSAVKYRRVKSRQTPIWTAKEENENFIDYLPLLLISLATCFLCFRSTVRDTSSMSTQFSSYRDNKS